ncbi:hypothetical protein AMECASPLE_005258 [Ameca splendens]|uniref:Uncharacterized protein n=1 Tax=Ameca splendens TaxID=208324 RepID=A0ABV0XN25_9TELE
MTQRHPTLSCGRATLRSSAAKMSKTSLRSPPGCLPTAQSQQRRRDLLASAGPTHSWSAQMRAQRRRVMEERTTINPGRHGVRQHNTHCRGRKKMALRSLCGRRQFHVKV